MTPEQIAELIAERDTLRSQLDALQSGDELPELPEPYDLRFDENEMQSYAIEAQAMVRAKMLAELGEVEAVAVADGTFNHNCPLGTPLYPRPLPAQDVNAELAYNKVDRFLRNNLGDDDYAEYSEALDTLANVKAAQQKG